MSKPSISSVDACVDEISQNCLAVRLRMLNRAITSIYDKGLRSFGMKTSQVNVLVVITKQGPVRPAMIGEILHMDASTVSRNVERMRVKGWLEIIEDETDSRAHLVRITKSGKDLIRRLTPAWRAAQERAVSLLGESAVDSINHSLKNIRP